MPDDASSPPTDAERHLPSDSPDDTSPAVEASSPDTDLHQRTRSTAADASTLPVQTTVCANCSRRFVGTYCPECGQRETPPSVLGLMSGFVREVVDLDGGFGPTLRALTLHPGTALRRYLAGARQSFMHPGRYLLAAVVVATVLTQLLGWTGATTVTGPADSVTTPPQGADSTGAPSGRVDTTQAGYQFGYALGQAAAAAFGADETAPTDGQSHEDEGARATSGADHSETAITSFFSSLGNHYLRMVFAVTLALFLGLVYHQMYPRAFRHRAGAVAVGMYVTAQITLLEHGGWAVFSFAQYAWTGQPVGQKSEVVGYLLPVIVSGGITAALFGQEGWSWQTVRAGGKGLFAAIIAATDATAFLIFILAVYGGVRTLWASGGHPPNPVLFGALAVVIGLVLVLLSLPHCVLWLYRRTRPATA